ncbi:MAG: helix-turn-helix transcriptional regulator [Acidobacteriia bacterium]|nr:helix-turn-helix transcriptional regulator [Terriglobia bacterium]
MKTLVNRQLRAMRVFRGMTQGELGQKIGKSQAWVCQLERGLQIPTDIDVALICRALNVSPDTIFPKPDCGFRSDQQMFIEARA